MRTDISIAFHLGAPHTDKELLFRSLRKSPELLAEAGFFAPRPKDYRRLLNEAIERSSQQEPTPEERELLLSTLTNQKAVGRLFLTNSNFMGVQAWMFNQATFYQNAGLRTNELRSLFPDNPVEFFLAIKDPATFVPESYHGQKSKDYQDFIGGMELENIRWSSVIERIQLANPDCQITVWCNEDTPIIWSSILSELAAVDAGTNFAGQLDVLRGIIAPDGMTRLEQYLGERPNLNEMQRRRVKGVFLEKFYLGEAVELEIDLPGWTSETVELLTDIYEEDVELIARKPGVNFISQ